MTVKMLIEDTAMFQKTLVIHLMNEYSKGICLAVIELHEIGVDRKTKNRLIPG